ncbi:ABC transporter ATP-binding protein [Microbispora rosea subsp. aerata]|nr:ABC transporter ATP-binding protein [Microbispora rosea]GGO23509.1 ABC transporter ATP-binding protein [Microbispora rosea subsp. aerata]GIH57832.1 ABC transporter ATP-binding protein [Microbispora rosea subsp. aerata]GLJ84451.1 ABC transporter ATP-binding protein [Microbispora rosea subsp. aerata]
MTRRTADGADACAAPPATGRVIARALSRAPARLVWLACWSVAEALPALSGGYAIARAVDDGFGAGRPGVGLMWLGVLAAAWAVAALAARQVVLIVAGIVEPFRDDLLERVVTGALRAGRGGDSSAVARMNHQVELARDAFGAIITVVRTFVFTLVSVAVGLTTLAPRVVPLVLGPVALGLGLFLVRLPALARRQREFIVADERTAAAVAALAGGLRDVTACGGEARVAASVGREVSRQARAARALARVTASRTLSLAVGAWLPIVLLIAGAPWLVRQGVTAGVILGSLTYVTQSLAPALGGLVQGLGVSGVHLAVTLERILHAPGPPVPHGDLRPDGVRLELRGVRFAYGTGGRKAAEPVIDGLDLDVPEGDHLAVVGPSGIGKSTLAALVAGVLTPDDGEVLVGGVPAARVHPAARALIPQEAYVFPGTLAENLTYLAPQASPERVDEAVEAFGLTELARRAGGGPLDPAELSAGERQLVALARTWLSPARLVVLDESTCHLDPRAEARAEAAFAARGGTLIVVAHRISSALRARRVLVMDGTRVLLGTHEEMVAASPLYADLVGHWEGPGRSPAGPVAQDADVAAGRGPQPAALGGDLDRLDA